MPTASAASTPAPSTRPSNTWRTASGRRGNARDVSVSCPVPRPYGRPAAVSPCSSPSSSPYSSSPPTPWVGCADRAEGAPVSKFLKAIERAEHERAGDAAAHAAVDGPPAAAPGPTAGSHPTNHVAPAAPDGAVALLQAGDRPTGYGAPLTRRVEDNHEGAFSTLLEPMAMVTPGRIDDHLLSL